MRIMPVRRENNESVHATLLPGAEQVVHPAVQRLAAHGRVARVLALGGGIDPVGNGRSTQDAELGGEIVGQSLDDHRVTAEREMWSMLFAGADGHEEPGVARERGTHGVGSENVEVQRQTHVVIAGCFASLATAEWLRSDAGVWAVLAGLAGLTAVVLAVRPPGPRHPLSVAAGLASLLIGVVLGAGALRVWRIECCWPALRERRVTG